ncbi:2-keto-4-pentenoate hydratase [Variovorax terrae]|uniref:Fumarylacetoacetate hydrolase family protein n=1 Tax=Variovorax terrae TaxID=2923278 RepID=A0A9X1VT41_9BURK|nr:fumarylacetoacetate hydrolase family protein [Variovorax terrae]MCJ0763411.1 fumarylacetoacetate hydrolase family protein [Variovorax terrae]
MPVPNPLDLDALAREFLAARQARQPLPPLLARHPGWSADQAYALAETIAAHRRQGGERCVGRKIGLTNPAGWAAMKTAAPIWGYVYDSSLVMAQAGRARVDLGQAMAPRIEPEIGFCLRRAIDPAATSFEALLSCIEWVAPCFEIIDCHFPEWSFQASEAIADFGVHYRLVVGEPYRLAAAPHEALAAALGDCAVTLSLNGDVAERGGGANTLGHPLQALRALVGLLASQPLSTPLQPGDIITTGTLTTPRDIGAGQRWRMQVEGLELAPLELELAGA